MKTVKIRELPYWLEVELVTAIGPDPAFIT
jgi:hypothetical protein